MKVHGNKGKKRTEEQRKRLSESHLGRSSWNKGLKTGKNPKISQRLKGRRHTFESIKKMKDAWKNRPKDSIRKGFKHSEETIQKMKEIALLDGRGKYNKGRPLTKEHRKKISEAHKGEKSYMWKGGISALNERIRQSMEYRIWRTAVFERDNYTCVWCKTKKSPFQADHIKPFAYFPELRFAIDNGRTLCVTCHKTTDTYGTKYKRQLATLRQ